MAYLADEGKPARTARQHPRPTKHHTRHDPARQTPRHRTDREERDGQFEKAAGEQDELGRPRCVTSDTIIASASIAEGGPWVFRIETRLVQAAAENYFERS